MRPGTIAFTEAWFKKITKDPAMCGKPYTDAICRGLVCWVAKDGVVMFRYRTRVKGVTRRVYERIAPWSSAFTVNHAREWVNVRRSEIAVHGLKPKAGASPTLEKAIPLYEAARRGKDKQASRRGAPLPGNWAEHCNRFQKVFKPLLEMPVSHLSRSDFVNAMSEYGKVWSVQRGKPWDERVLRPMMVCAMPMLRWFTKRRWIDTLEIEDLVPSDYDRDTRYLLPGEWQACAPHVDALADDCGLFLRFILYTCVRSEQALNFQWSECNWGEPEKWIDEAGNTQDAIIWIVPKKIVGGMKARNVGGAANDMPNRVLIVGEALVILKRLRAIYEENQKLPVNEGYTGVFTRQMVTRWRTARTSMQRWIEEEAGTEPWDRMTLRHTHATWLPATGCDERLVTMSMVHTVRDQTGAAQVTRKRYIGTDAARRFMENDPLAQLAPWHVKLHRLIRDIEAGHLSDTLAAMIGDMVNGQVCNQMCERYKIDRKFIRIEKRSQPPKLRVIEA